MDHNNSVMERSGCILHLLAKVKASEFADTLDVESERTVSADLKFWTSPGKVQLLLTEWNLRLERANL